MNTAEHTAHMAQIEERVRQGLPVTQEDWDRAAGLFEDGDTEEMVPPEPLAAKSGKRPPPAGIAKLIRDAFKELEHEEK